MESLKSLFQRYESMLGAESVKENVNEEFFKEEVLESQNFEFEYADSDFMYKIIEELKNSLFDIMEV